MAANGLSTYAQQMILGALFREGAFTVPEAWYVGLHTANPGLTGTSEVSGNAYARVAVAFDAVEANGSAGWKVKNTASVLFAKATPAGWGEVTHFSVWDALTSGNCLSTGKLTTALTVTANMKPEFEAGAFYIGTEQKTEV